MKLHHGLPLLLSALAIGACSDTTNYNFRNSVETAQAQFDALLAMQEPTPTSTTPEATFDPATGDIPFPNTLLFSGSADGTLNIPLGDGVAEDDFGDPSVALNTLDGFSTTEAITTTFGNNIDPATVVLGQSVFAYEVTVEGGLVTGIVEELAGDKVLATVSGGSTLAIVPLVPLKESTYYMVIATSDVLGTDGVASSRSSTFGLVAGDVPLTGELVAALEPVRVAVNSMIDAAVGSGVEEAGIVQAWTTLTQSITPVMTSVKNASAAGGAITMAATGATTAAFNPALPGIADVYIGTLDVPYYLTRPATRNDVSGISGFWRGLGGSFLTRLNPTPVANSIETIPVLMSVPNASSGQLQPASGWPVVIFVHGVTADRTNMLAIADSMAQAGFAVIAIDQVLHGLTVDTDPPNPLLASNTLFPNDSERTFGIDLANNETGEAGPDGVADTSGTHYYSPARLLSSRDNLRQSAADLLVLSASIGNISAVALDANRKALIGHSLGGATATVYAALDDSLSSVSLGMPAAGLVRTTITSRSFGPPLIAGLAAAGIEAGTADFEQFLVAAQTIVDSGDAINFGAQAASMHPVHMIEVVGDGIDPATADTVVLNNIVNVPLPGDQANGATMTAPLAGTEALASVMGLCPGIVAPGLSCMTTVTANTSGPGLVKFTAGDHGSLLSPAASLDATVEMQSQLATFAATNGTLISISNPAVIKTSE